MITMFSRVPFHGASPAYEKSTGFSVRPTVLGVSGKQRTYRTPFFLRVRWRGPNEARIRPRWLQSGDSPLQPTANASSPCIGTHTGGHITSYKRIEPEPVGSGRQRGYRFRGWLAIERLVGGEAL